MRLYNRTNKEELKLQLEHEKTRRITASFYRYVIIEDPESLRDQLYIEWNEMDVLGRIYIAAEGINAQLSVPKKEWEKFTTYLKHIGIFKSISIKTAVEDDGKSFYKLNIKVRDQIVGDGLTLNELDLSKTGNHLNAFEFNDALNDPDSVLIDMRNYYESEVGHFKNAICPDADTFKDLLPLSLKLLNGKEDQKILMYCTGGIRCEKASAYLLHKGFKDVNQLDGGIINYAHQVMEQGLESKFIGKNFVFDQRLGERISPEIISSCHQCGKICDTHTNCGNDACHLLFIQCEACAKKYQRCCSDDCKEIAQLPIEEQRGKRKGQNDGTKRNIYKSRLRPKLNELLKKS